MKIGLHIGKFDWANSPENIGPKLAEIARAADENGFHSLWVMDHLFQLGSDFGIIHGPIDANMLEAYTTLGYIAACTENIKIGVQVTCNFFRPPGFLIKTMSTLDVLSGGRTYFGIGAGWFEREAKGLGLPFPSLKERFERLEEILKLSKHMWDGNTQPFEGKFTQLEEPINNPQPLIKPHPPILIGGSGEKKTLRFVAKYGDACNIVIGTSLKEAGVLYNEKTTWEDEAEYIKKKFDILKKHCEDVGRPYDEIERTSTTYIKPGDMQAEEILEICKVLHNAGVQHVMFNIPNVDEIAPLDLIGKDVIPVVEQWD